MIEKMTKDWQKNRTVKGWVFTDHSDAEIIAIRKFLKSGDREDLPESYRPIFDVVITQKK